MQLKIPKATGKSKCDPSLSKSAGARLMVILLAGRLKPKACMAERTLSLLSAIALSGRPTMVKFGKPDDICTCKSTGKVSSPLKVMVLMLFYLMTKRHWYRVPLNIC